APASRTGSTLTRCWTLAIMPRISGRSSLITESLIRCNPRRRTVSFWSLGRSMTLRTCVTLSLVTVDLLELGGPGRLQAFLGGGHGFQHGLGGHLVHLTAAQARDLLGPTKLLETRDGRLHDVDLVAGTERLRQDVLDPGALDQRANRALAHHDERGEREAAAALDDLGHPVDGDDPLLVQALLLLGRVVASHQIDRPPSLAPSASAATRPWYSRPPRSNTARSIPRSLARPA